jgi:CheY-like chemotaxis protein
MDRSPLPSSFEQNLQDALNRLYDPSANDALALIAPALGLSAHANTESVRQLIIQAIEGMKPAPDTPANTRSWRFYELLMCRYVRRMTQDETAEHLSITPRHLRREQALAVEALAAALRPVFPIPPSSTNEEATADSDYSNQVRAELSALQNSTHTNGSGPSACVIEAIKSVSELVSTLAARYNVSLEISQIPESLHANLPLATLRQLLMQAISEAVRQINGGILELNCVQDENQVCISMLGRLPSGTVPGTSPLADRLIRELANAYNGTFDYSWHAGELSIEICLPADQITVLVVDDNSDLVHFYQRYVQGTRYRITAMNEGSRIFETIEVVHPDLIVLDAMLPNVDGWELLSHLQAHPATKHIPVIICSVVREEELALILGAVAYLPKPVRRQEFLQALDQAVKKITDVQ